MTEEKIRDINFLIAGFDDNIELYGDSEFIHKKHHICNQNTFQYHSSWDWIIPVIRKAKAMPNSSEWQNWNALNDRLLECEKPEWICFWLADFIKWHNQNK